MSLQGIVLAQQNGSIFGVDFIGNPYILTQFIGFFLFLVAAQAELTQTPFDMPVAESELVAGYMVEYTGFRFLFFFIGEFGTAFAFAALAATLFLGGWAIPGSTATSPTSSGPFVLFAKLMVVAFLMFWVRFTYPRLREDQLQALAWKFLIPLAPRSTSSSPASSRWRSDVMAARSQDPRRHQRSRRHVPHHARRCGHRAVPAREGRSAAPGPGRHRAQGGELHGLHAVRAAVPRLVHLHRGAQGAAPAAPRGRPPRTVSVLDRFDIDYALCMYCGICVEVCPFDALFWSPEYEYSSPSIANLLHDKEKLGEWMETVPRTRAARARRRGQG